MTSAAFHSIRTVLVFSHPSRSALEFCNTPDGWHSVKIGNCSCRAPTAESDNLIPCPQAIVWDPFPSPSLLPSIEKQQILCLGILGYAVAWAGKQNRIFEVHSGKQVVHIDRPKFTCNNSERRTTINCGYSSLCLDNLYQTGINTFLRPRIPDSRIYWSNILRAIILHKSGIYRKLSNTCFQLSSAF